MKLMPRLTPILLTLLLVTATAQRAFAADFCVATGNQLATAMDTAGSNNESDTIKIEFGTLTSNVQALQNYQWIFNGVGDEYATTISGGWTKGNGCASLATNDPAATVLDAQYFGPVFLADLRFDFSGALTIKNLTLARGKVFDFACYNSGNGVRCASGLGIEAWGLSGSSVTIDNVLIRHGAAEAGAQSPIVNLDMTGSGTLKLRNSIVMGNNLSAGANTTGVNVRVANNTIVYITNNTIFGNTVTTNEAGLSVEGVATLTNNAVADNTSTGAGTAYQFTARFVSQMTLRNNHFANHRYDAAGIPFSESGTTQGDAQWSQSGVRMIPDTESVLRDSGINSPSGGIPSIDFSGKARVINTVMDRGAVEADAVTPLGPNVVPSSPVDGSTTPVYGVAGNLQHRDIVFTTSGGTLGGSTELLCAVISGTAQIVANGNQTISSGSNAAPVIVSIPITSTPQTHTVLCSFSRVGGAVGTYTLYYRGMTDLMFGNGFE